MLEIWLGCSSRVRILILYPSRIQGSKRHRNIARKAVLKLQRLLFCSGSGYPAAGAADWRSGPGRQRYLLHWRVRQNERLHQVPVPVFKKNTYRALLPKPLLWMWIRSGIRKPTFLWCWSGSYTCWKIWKKLTLIRSNASIHCFIFIVCVMSFGLYTAPGKKNTGTFSLHLVKMDTAPAPNPTKWRRFDRIWIYAADLCSVFCQARWIWSDPVLEILVTNGRFWRIHMNNQIEPGHRHWHILLHAESFLNYQSVWLYCPF